MPYTIRASVSECCRNPLIHNIFNSASLNLITETLFTPYINGVPNSTPTFLVAPEPVAAINQLYAHSPLAVDSDGDSLTFRLDTPRTSPPSSSSVLLFPSVTGYVYPWQLPSALNGFNPSTGTVLWLPTFVARYQYRYAVDEWRNGIRIGIVFRDVQVAEFNGGQNTTASSIQVNGSPLTGLNLPTFTVAGGSTVTFNVSISDPDATQKQLWFTGEPFALPSNPATFVSNLDGNLLTGVFYWTLGAGQDRTAPYLVHLKYREITSLYAFSRDIPILITVTPSVSGITGNTLPSESDQFSVVHLADGTAGLRYQFSSDTYLKVVAFDMQGRAVATVHEGVVSGGQHLHIASLQALQSGAYVFRAATDKGKFYTAKWIK